MKKVLVLLFGCMMLLSGCGGKPSDVSQEIYDTAVYAIDVTDMYLDGEATIEETKEKIDGLNIEYNPDDNEYEKDSDIESSLVSLEIYVHIVESGYGDATISDIKDARNSLAEEINYKD